MSAEINETSAFDGIVAYETACAAGTHDRTLVGSPGARPLGLAWVPRGLGALPSGLGPRIVEMEGPGGMRLLFVPFERLSPVLRAGAARLGIEPSAEPRFRALASLEPGATEPAVHGLFDLVSWLASTARAPQGPPIDHRVDFAAQAPLHALLLAGGGTRPPVILGEERSSGTGSEERTLLVELGGRVERRRYVGATLAGAGAAALAAERERAVRLQSELTRYLAEIDAVLSFRGR